MGKTRGTSNVGGDLVFEIRADGGSLDERARFTGAGDLGIGDSSPNCRLAIADPAEHAAYAAAAPTVGNCMMQLYNHPPDETTNDHCTIQFGVNGGSHNRVNTISAIAESAGNRKMATTFCTDDAGSRTEKMRITGAVSYTHLTLPTKA